MTDETTSDNQASETAAYPYEVHLYRGIPVRVRWTRQAVLWVANDAYRAIPCRSVIIDARELDLGGVCFFARCPDQAVLNSFITWASAISSQLRHRNAPNGTDETPDGSEPLEALESEPSLSSGPSPNLQGVYVDEQFINQCIIALKSVPKVFGAESPFRRTLLFLQAVDDLSTWLDDENWASEKDEETAAYSMLSAMQHTLNLFTTIASRYVYGRYQSLGLPDLMEYLESKAEESSTDADLGLDEGSVPTPP